MKNLNQILNVLRIKYKNLKKRFNIIKGINNNIIVDKSSTTIIRWNILGDNNNIIIGKNCYIQNLLIYTRGNDHNIIIGDNVLIQGGEFWIEDNNCTIKIGNLTSIEQAHLAVTENGRSIFIGEDCMLSNEIQIRTGDSHAIKDITTDKKINSAKDIFINNHVWIGSRVTILKGVNVGANSVIGTGSIVTKSIYENCIASGVPAKVVKENIIWTRER